MKHLLVSYEAYLSGKTCMHLWKKRTCLSRRKSMWSKWSTKCSSSAMFPASSDVTVRPCRTALWERCIYGFPLEAPVSSYCFKDTQSWLVEDIVLEVNTCMYSHGGWHNGIAGWIVAPVLYAGRSGFLPQFKSWPPLSLEMHELSPSFAQIIAPRWHFA